jgi:hypothetical protein
MAADENKATTEPVTSHTAESRPPDSEPTVQLFDWGSNESVRGSAGYESKVIRYERRG